MLKNNEIATKTTSVCIHIAFIISARARRGLIEFVMSIAKMANCDHSSSTASILNAILFIATAHNVVGNGRNLNDLRTIIVSRCNLSGLGL
jgi:hypothetical protein